MSGSTHPFAPGAITRHTSRRRAELARWWHWAVRISAWTTGFAFVAGVATAVRADEATPHADRPALQPTTLGLHLYSHHVHGGCEGFNPGSAGATCLGWNNANVGAYLRWANGLTVGTVRNSLYRQGVYAAWSGERDLVQLGGLPVSVAITLGVTSGYDRLVQDDFAGQPGKGQHTAVRCDAAGRCRTVLLRSVLAPLVVPSVALQVTPRTAVRLSYVPQSGADASGAFHLSMEFKLP